MSRIAAFRFTLRPTAEQDQLLKVVGGAARLGFNTGLAMVRDALLAREAGDGDTKVPWTSFDLINAINQWRRSEFTAEEAEWRKTIPAVVFEEAVVDLARGLKAFREFAEGVSQGPKVGFPRFKKKHRSPYSFRIRNQANNVRVGSDGDLRSIRIPKLGDLRVLEDTRKLRRLLRPGTGADGQPTEARAKITHVTIRQHRGRWLVLVTVKAPDLHEAVRHPARADDDPTGFIGVDLGLIDMVVTADEFGREHDRIPAPRVQRNRLEGERRRARSVSRKEKGSNRWKKAVRRLAKYHGKTAAIRRHELHRVTNLLVKNHDRLVIESLSLRRMLANHKIALSLSDAALAKFVRILKYKADWFGTLVLMADPYFPSTKTCSRCRHRKTKLPLSERTFRCEECGLEIDRDLNASVNLAQQGRILLERLSRDQVSDPGPGSTGPGNQRPHGKRDRHRRHHGAAELASATAGTLTDAQAPLRDP